MAGDRADAAGRGLVVDDADRADAVARRPPQRLLDRRRVGAAPPIRVEDRSARARAASPSRSRASRTSRCAPSATASPGDSVLTSAASHAPVPEAGKMTTGPLGAEDPPHPGQHRAAEVGEAGAAMVDRRLGDRAQHAVGHVGGPGDLQEMPAGRTRCSWSVLQ